MFPSAVQWTSGKSGDNPVTVIFFPKTLNSGMPYQTLASGVNMLIITTFGEITSVPDRFTKSVAPDGSFFCRGAALGEAGEAMVDGRASAATPIAKDALNFIMLI
jgi:hypothetical protein